MKRASSAGAAALYALISSPVRKGACAGRPLRSAWTQLPPPPSNVRAQRPTFRPQGRVGHLQHDAAHVLVSEEIVAGELQVVQGAPHIEEDGTATPAREEAVVASLCYPCLSTSAKCARFLLFTLAKSLACENRETRDTPSPHLRSNRS